MFLFTGLFHQIILFSSQFLLLLSDSSAEVERAKYCLLCVQTTSASGSSCHLLVLKLSGDSNAAQFTIATCGSLAPQRLRLHHVHSNVWNTSSYCHFRSGAKYVTLEAPQLAGYRQCKVCSPLKPFLRPKRHYLGFFHAFFGIIEESIAWSIESGFWNPFASDLTV